MYTVTANVNSEKYGKGTLVARLTEAEFIEYANLSDADKLQFLKDHHARFQLDVDQLSEEDVKDYKVQRGGRRVPVSDAASAGSGQPVRKMRIINNGKDSGWVDVTEENEDKYNQLMDSIHQANERMDQAFDRMFDSLRPGRLFEDFADPFKLDFFGEDSSKKSKDDSADSSDNSSDK